MAEPKNNPQPSENRVSFTSDCDILEIREEDTKPGKMSERLRKLLEEKYGHKNRPNGPTEGTNGP
jgi:hypothetical protein